MSDSKKSCDKLVVALQSQPDGAEARTTALKITDIVYGIRLCHVFDTVFDTDELDPETSNKLQSLLEIFRQQAASIFDEQLPKSDVDLYNRVIYPLIARQIDSSR